MKNVGLFIGYLILLFSCSANPSDSAFSKSNPQPEFIKTTHQSDNSGIIPTLITDLKNQKFELENRDAQPMNSFYSWKEDVQYIIQGDGISTYHFKRTEAKPENYYPDFTITVFQFTGENEAQSCLDKIEEPAKTGNVTRGSEPLKNPQAILRKGNAVFLFSTRAEMFRGYIEDCAKRIEGYSFSSSPTQ